MGKSKDEESNTNFERELEVLAKTLRKAIPDPLKDPLAKGSYGLSYKHQKLLSDLIDFHEREGKVEWWDFFDRKDTKTSSEKYDDTEIIANAEKNREKTIKRSKGYIYKFSQDQPLKLSTKPGINMSFALAELLKKGDKFIPKNVIEKKVKK